CNVPYLLLSSFPTRRSSDLVRLPLWPSEAECKNAIREFLPSAHILKISDEELSFVTGKKDEKEAIAWLFQGSVEAVIYTKGKERSEEHTSELQSRFDLVCRL